MSEDRFRELCAEIKEELKQRKYNTTTVELVKRAGELNPALWRVADFEVRFIYRGARQ